MTQQRLSILFLVVAFACFFAISQATSDTIQLGENETGRLKTGYYTFRPDYRKCAYPMCGGYFLDRVNVDGTAADDRKYIVKFIFNNSDDRFNKTLVKRSDPETVVVFGHFRMSSQGANFLDFVVLDAFVALPLPDHTGEYAGKFYQLEDSGIKCYTTPCPSIRASLINTKVKVTVNDFIDPYFAAVGELFDYTWYLNKILNEEQPLRGIVQGSIGKAGVIDIARTFVRIPDPSDYCDDVALPKCKEGTVPVYNRDAKRCLVLDTCQTPGACILSIPVCPEGYELYQHPAGEFACPASYCDASFLDQTRRPPHIRRD
eukprot:gene10745-12509_t